MRASHGAVSRGTETLVFRGEVPPRAHAAMRCPFQEGDFPGPVKYGYCTLGTVLEGPGLEDLGLEDSGLAGSGLAGSGLAGSGGRVGETVFCLHPHQDFFLVPEEAAFPLPGDVPPARGVLGALMETALNAVWDAKAEAGEAVAVIGGGAVGLLTGYLAQRLAGADVTVTDINPARAHAAAALGLAFTTDPPKAASQTLIYHASASPDGLATALVSAAFEGRIVELSWYGTTPVSLALGEDFHHRRLTIQSSQVGAVAPSRRATWSRADRLTHALGLLCEPCLDILIDSESRFQDLPHTMAALAEGRLPALCHRIIYD